MTRKTTTYEEVVFQSGHSDIILKVEIGPMGHKILLLSDDGSSFKIGEGKRTMDAIVAAWQEIKTEAGL